MKIRLTIKGIKETIGKGKRFQNLPKIVKQQKIATLRRLPTLIKESILLEDDIVSYHSNEGEKFAYFLSHILIDDEVHSIRIVVKKKVNSKHKKFQITQPIFKRQIITRFRTFK